MTDPVVARIQDEAFQRSQVMDTLSYLADVHGPRLTNSPQFRAAVAWAQGRLRDWQLANVHGEPFPFGRGWSAEREVSLIESALSTLLLALPLRTGKAAGAAAAGGIGLGAQTRIAFRDRSYLCLHAGFFTCGFHISFLITHLPGEVGLCGLPASVSNTAGTFVCNHILYALMDMAGRRTNSMRGGFLHVPYLPQMVARGTPGPSMALEDIVKGIEIIVAVSAARNDDIHTVEGRVS